MRRLEQNDAWVAYSCRTSTASRGAFPHKDDFPRPLLGLIRARKRLGGAMSPRLKTLLPFVRHHVTDFLD